MKRALVNALLAAVLIASLGGCDGTTDVVTTGAEPSSAASAASTSEAPQGFEPIPAEGAGEAVALAAVPAALTAAEAMQQSSGLSWPDLSGLEPELVAYLVRADYDGQVALFEVRADGTPHNIYAYPRAFDSGSILWTPAADSQGPTAAAGSDREKAAVEAVRSVMADAFPGETLSFAVHGYRFVYIRDGAAVLTLEIDPQGGVISVGS